MTRATHRQTEVNRAQGRWLPRALLWAPASLMSRCFSVPPQLLPHATDAVWFMSPVVDEDEELGQLEKKYEAQVGRAHPTAASTDT